MSQTTAPTESLTTTTSLTTASSSAVPLPPFRSTKEFPRAPKQDQLPALYADCRQALQEANSARQILKGRLEAKKRVIAAIRLEIDRLEQDLSLEAGTRASLHAMNLKLVKALKEMDGLVGELDQLVHEANRVPRSLLARLIDSLKALIQQWRSFKRRQQQEMASLAGSEQDGER
jgi:chromosome segregation ATPase